jgi:hypothetical protein
MRSYILTSYKLGLKAKDIHENLVTSYGKDAYSYDTVVKWIDRFRTGKIDIDDAFRSGRPITATSSLNISIVKDLIDNDPHISYNQIEEETGLNHWVINQIINQHLGLRKVTSRWVPYDLTGAQQKRG